MIHLRAKNVIVRHGRRVALNVGHWEQNEPSLTSLVGPNGAGKTTLLQLVAGLTRPSEGTVTLDGVAATDHQNRARVAFIPDRPVLFNDLCIADNMNYVARLAGLSEPDGLSRDLAAGFELEPLLDRFPAQLSRGQRQKAGIVVSTSRPVELLLLDEPSIALDAEARTILGQVLGGHASGQAGGNGRQIVVATHDPELTTVCTHSIELIDGVLVTHEIEADAEAAPEGATDGRTSKGSRQRPDWEAWRRPKN